MTSAASSVRILLADDHTLFSDGLALQLAQADPAMTVVGQVFRGADVLPAVQAHTPHVVLLDINLPAPTGIECLRQLSDTYPAVKTIMLTMYAYKRFVDECRGAGAAAYLLKHVQISTMIDTIRRVLIGERIFPTSPTVDLHAADSFVVRFKLTPTELKVIRLMRQGLNTQQIGDQLFVSFETVKSHRKNIYRKLTITHLSDLIAFAHEHGL
ncbi:response regulator [Fibrella aquatilis]|uniref:Response regulator transcription factor n=1 Tax=Fibrella aquatilis TaxID=2817059 RepID=A0A939G921_9BACT|nr:response regulator transcription factor [Fibrella aquatilis]MBO0934692.1 response regulator transcription factor [Fibrella aquatilis]